METEESIVGHAQAKGAALEEAAQSTLVLCFQVIPLEIECSGSGFLMQSDAETQRRHALGVVRELGS